MSSGCVGDSATAQRVEVDRQRAAAGPASLPTPGRATRDRGTPRAGRRSGRSISSWNAGRMLNVNGSRRFIWNVSGRHDTCGHTSMPSARAVGVRRHDLLVPRVALDREQRGPRDADGRAARCSVEHVGVRDLLAGQQRDRRPCARRAAARAASAARRGRRRATAPAGRGRRCASATTTSRTRPRPRPSRRRSPAACCAISSSVAARS